MSITMNARMASIAGMLWLILIVPVTGQDKPPIDWRTDYDAARKESVEKGLPLLIEFSTEECFHCRRLENGPFRDPSITKIVGERFIPLKIDGNRSPKLTQALRVNAYPTLVMAATDGKIVGFIEGYFDVKPLTEHLQRVLAVQTPDWMARDFQEASKAVGAGEYAKAVTLLKAILEDGKDQPVQSKARQVLGEIEQQAAGRLVRVKKLQDQGQSAEAVDLLTELISRYAGTSSASDGAKMLTSLADRPEIQDIQRGRRSKDLLAQAREAYKVEKFHEALDLCEILETTYKDTHEGKLGSQLANEIRVSPEKLARACESLNERLATMYATLGETWMKKGERELAAANFEKAVRAAPASLIARDSQAKLANLQSKPPTIPTGFQKPEK
jgi:thioredoxin-related protein/predicted negative regulator of RcsB-dependent stress response